ncbi:tRNA (adenosine(37)-N6)-threonylcarbamoyltransferase complex dimerization subunit type 1 TsaB [Castellaniella sp. GW247-6E4]|uniref:tRNA (adenosine(37)-N6)-threonylcarbamoyltransferase complex dimerization subunit type 1 TsaB n=1 Tax=Castellaniella sp. GW247-6E4 TaxID=3140380 RepID=UPI00331606DA
MSDFHILAFETSSNLCGVALLSRTDGRLHLRGGQHEGRGEHAGRILPLAGDLLAEAGVRREDLSAVAFGQGPGGFTGLRVACGVAQGLAVALGLPVIPVDSMRAIALQGGAGTDGVHVVLQDARMHEVYAAVYRRGGGHGWWTLQAPTLLGVADVPIWLEREAPGWGGGAHRVHGDALAAFPELDAALRALGFEIVAPTDAAGARAQATTIARLAAHDWDAGRTLPAEAAAPAYVRDKVAYTTRERADGLGGNPQAVGGAWTLHRMAESDLDEVAAIERRVQSFPWTRGNFADGLAAGYKGWVLRRMGGMQGFALLMEAPDMAHLLVIGVRPNDQGQGVGSRLLRVCLDHCRAAGFGALTLEVRPSNVRAVGFYRKFGFRHVGTRKGYYPSAHGEREDGWIMTLHLVAA